MSSLLLIGARGIAKRVLDTFGDSDIFSEIALLDGYAEYDHIYSHPIIGKSDDLEDFKSKFSHALVCLADTRTRMHYLERVRKAGYEIPSFVHPRAYVSKAATIGVGVIVNAMAAVQADTTLCDGCIIETGAVVEHDNVLGECVTISPNASTMGFVEIGSKTFIGGGACVINTVKIGENVLVGAGSVVMSDMPDNVLVAGCPAEVKRPIEDMKHAIWPGVYPEGKF